MSGTILANSLYFSRSRTHAFRDLKLSKINLHAGMMVFTEGNPSKCFLWGDPGRGVPKKRDEKRPTHLGFEPTTFQLRGKRADRFATQGEKCLRVLHVQGSFFEAAIRGKFWQRPGARAPAIVLRGAFPHHLGISERSSVDCPCPSSHPGTTPAAGEHRYEHAKPPPPLCLSLPWEKSQCAEPLKTADHVHIKCLSNHVWCHVFLHVFSSCGAALNTYNRTLAVFEEEKAEACEKKIV